MPLFKKKEQTPMPPPTPVVDPIVDQQVVKPTEQQSEQPTILHLELIIAQNVEAILENIQRTNMILTELVEEIKKK